MPCDTSATEMTLIKNGIIRWKSHLDIFGGMSFGWNELLRLLFWCSWITRIGTEISGTFWCSRISQISTEISL